MYLTSFILISFLSNKMRYSTFVNYIKKVSVFEYPRTTNIDNICGLRFTFKCYLGNWAAIY